MLNKRPFVGIFALWLGTHWMCLFALATQFGAVADGPWGLGATWTPSGGPPGPLDTAFIGSLQPVGSAAIANVTLDSNRSVSDLYIGSGAGAAGGLVLAGHELTVAGSVYVGHNGGLGSVTSSGGTLRAFWLTVEGQNSFGFGANDNVYILDLRDFSQATTAAAENVTGLAYVIGDHTSLTLGASLQLAGELYIGGGSPNAPAMVNANGHDITTRNLWLGSQGAGEIINDGAITVTEVLNVYDTAFTFDQDDQVTYVVAENASINLHPTTQLYSMILAGNSTTTFYDGNQVQYLSLYNSLTTTVVATNNLTAGVDIGGSNTTLSMMADLHMNRMTINAGAPGAPAIVDANGHAITAAELYINNLAVSALVDDGPLQVGLLRVGNGAFALDADDNITYIDANNTALSLHPTTHAYSLTLRGSSSTMLFASNHFQYLSLVNGQETVLPATANVSHGIELSGPNSQLTLAADLNLGNRLFVGGGSLTQPAVLSANGHHVTARELWMGVGGPGELRDEGYLTVTHLLRVYEDASLRGGFDEVDGILQVYNDATLRVTQQEDHTRGLSFKGSELEITGQGVLQLEFDNIEDPFGEWIFRWAGDRVAAIESLLSSGRIVVQSPHPFHVVNNGDGYTYIARFLVDFNEDGRINCADLAVLGAAIVSGSIDLQFDLTGDGQVTIADRTAWLQGAGRSFLRSGNSYLAGDANLDGVVDGSDFGIWNANKFTTSSSWCNGDFNTDGVVDGSDFGLWNANKFTSAELAKAVPEPNCCSSMAALASLLTVRTLSKWLRITRPK